MSVDYCHKHHNYYDTDFETECLQCLDEEVEQSEQKGTEQVFFIHGVGSSTCKHKPMNKELGYVGWQEWADRKTRQGHIQRKCKDCDKYLFKCEI